MTRIAGEEGWQLCRKELDWKEPGEVFAAAVLAFESEDEKRIAEVVTIGSAEPSLARGLISALGWLTFAQAEPHIKQLLASPPWALQRVGIAASAIHRQNPGTALVSAISSTDPLLKARALRANTASEMLALNAYLKYAPRGEKAPDALYRLGHLQWRTGDTQAARLRRP